MGKTRRWAALVAGLALVATGGCGAGQLAQTADQVSGNGGAEGEIGRIDVQHAMFAFTGEIVGDAVYQPGQDAPLQLTIVNEAALQADRLLAVSSPIATSGLIIGDARIPGGQAVTAGYDEPVASITVPPAEAIGVILVGLTEPVRSGLLYPVSFTFERAGTLTLELPVEVPDVLPERARAPGPDNGARELETGPEVPAPPG